MVDVFRMVATNKRHKQLWSACKLLPQDYAPYGKVKRWVNPKKAYPDCSGGCRYFAQLYQTMTLGKGAGCDDPDWGVCTNPKSHRCGLLTYEHQGCFQFKPNVVIIKPHGENPLTKVMQGKVSAAFARARRICIEQDVLANPPPKNK